MITYLKKPRLRHPQMLAAWPGMGYVAFRVVGFLLDQLDAERFAFIHPEEFFTPHSVEVDQGLAGIPDLPETAFYFWKNPYSGSDLVLLLGEAQPDHPLQMRMAQEAASAARDLKIFRLMTFAAAPCPIPHQNDPGLWGAANTPELRDYLRTEKIRLLKVGQISGLNGLLLGVAERFEVPGLCLLGEVPYYAVNMENPRASRAILETLGSLLHIPIDLTPLEEEVERFDREIEEMGKKARETMSSILPADGELDEYEDMMAAIEDDYNSAPEDEGVPPEVLLRIEELFRLVRKDPARAAQLKAELDRWGLYEHFEDRFLDLFRSESESPEN